MKMSRNIQVQTTGLAPRCRDTPCVAGLCQQVAIRAPAAARAVYRGEQGDSQAMPDVPIVFWRDIPAQVIVGKGRRAAKVALPERFEQAIDRAAMKVGARDTDAYLAEWHKVASGSAPGTDAEAAEATAARIDSDYDSARLRALIDNDGWA